MSEMERDKALEMLLIVATEPAHVERARQLAMQWPSLAAALGDLLAANEHPVPRPLRAAANLLRAELGKPSVAAVAEPELPAQPLEAGPWCFCSGGGSQGDRGHLRGGWGCVHG